MTCCFFFFFKQKTAYEMRISDWSSDVCSSDLVDVLTLTATPIPRTLGMSLEGIRDFSVIATAPQKRLAIKTFVRREDGSTIREATIGRASCRERVSKYV